MASKTVHEQVQGALKFCAERVLEQHRLAATFEALAEHITPEAAAMLRRLLR